MKTMGIRWSRLAEHPGLLALTALCLIFWLSGWATSVAEVGKPFPGFFVEQCLDVATLRPEGWTGTTGELANYDRLESANGVRLETPADLQRVVQSVPVGTPMTYRYERSGKTGTVTIPTQRFGWAEFGRSTGVILASGFILMLVGLVAFLLKPDNPAARAHLLMTLMGGVNLACIQDEYLGHRYGPLAFGLMFFFGGAVIHLALAFPTVPAWIQRRRWLAALPYVASALSCGWVLLSTRAAGISSDPAGVASYLGWLQVYSAWIGLGLLCLIGRTLHATARASTALARCQARAVLLGTLLGFLPATVAWILPVVTGRIDHVSSQLVAVEYLGYHAFPISVAYAILRHRLFDVSWVARRAMLYAVLVGLLGGAYGVLTLLGAGYLDRHKPAFYTVLVVIALGIAARPLHEWLKRRIDRLFLGDRAEGMRLLAGFAIHGPAETSEVAHQLLEVIQRAIRPAWATVRLGDQVWGEEGGDEVPLALELPLGERGALRLGPKHNGFSYHAEETQLLQVATAQAAIACENRDLYREREQLLIQEAVNSALARQRGQILSEVLHDLGSDLFRIQIAASLLSSETGSTSEVDAIAESLGRIETLLNEKTRALRTPSNR